MGIAIGVIVLLVLIYALGNGFAKTIAQSINGSQKVAKAAPVVTARVVTTSAGVAAKAVNTGVVVAGVGTTKAKIKLAEVKSTSKEGFSGFLSKVREEMAEIKSSDEVDEVRQARVTASKRTA